MFQKLKRSLNRHLFGKDPEYHDPYEDPAEQFYARIYLRYLEEQIGIRFRNQPASILDVGCHTGRLSVPLARAGHRVTAIDSSRFHLKRAERHAREEGTQCQFMRGDAFQRILHFKPESFDLVLCTEVLYQRPDFREQMEKLLRLVNSGGLLATSHRTLFFYLSGALASRDWDEARSILGHSEGEIQGSYFNWQTPEEIRDLYRGLGVELLTLRPIGAFTGNGEEGMARICDLAGTTELERRQLFEIESCDREEFSVLGRYLFAIGRKTA